jgi:hypothetical protein
MDEMNRMNNDFAIKEGVDSVLGKGRQGPEFDKSIVMPDGVKIKCGKVINYVERDR